MNPFRDDQERKQLLTYVLAGFFIIALYFGFQRASLVLDTIGQFFSIISPFIIGYSLHSCCIQWSLGLKTEL